MARYDCKDCRLRTHQAGRNQRGRYHYPLLPPSQLSEDVQGMPDLAERQGDRSEEKITKKKICGIIMIITGIIIIVI